MDYKKLGEIVELKFYLKAFEQGLIVSKPFGDSAKYDFIVDNGRRLIRVQVKSTSDLESTKRLNRYRINCTWGGKNKEIYKCEHVDFIVCYINPYDTWYIIPILETRGCKTLNLYPHRAIKSKTKATNGSYEQYKNLWGILC